MNFTNETSKALRLLANAVVFAASLTAGSALADGPRRMIGNGTNTSGNYTTAISWSAEDGGAVIAPGAEGSDACVYVLQPADSSHKITFNANVSFPDVPVELDNPALPVRTQNSRTILFPQMTVKSGTAGIAQIQNGMATWNGNYAIDSGATLPIAAWNTGSGANTTNVKLIDSSASSLVGDADSAITYRCTVNDTKLESGDMTATSTLTIGSGDASGFKGKYILSDPTWEKGSVAPCRTRLVFVSATAFGDPTSELADAVTLNDGAYLSLCANVIQYATRGIMVAAGKKGGIEAASDLALTAPVSTGSGATFEKIGAGTVTLDGDCTGASAMEVTEGTLVLGALGSFANGLAVTVKSGATLVQNKYVGNIAVTCEEGGTYEQDIQYVVPYSDAAGASTPLDFTAAMPELPLSIRLTESVEIASFADNGWTAKRIDVARLPSDTTATAEDFNDGTLKTYGLPKTSFEIESREGYKALVLVAKPVIWSTGTVGDNKNGGFGINGNIDANPWSYGTQAQSGYDYLVTNYVRGTGYYIYDAPDFAGDSLTFFGENSLSIAMTSAHVDFGDATYCGNVEIYYNQTYFGGSNNRKPWSGITGGTATIAEDANLTLTTRQPKDSTDIRTNRMAVAVSGEGNLTLKSVKMGGSQGTAESGFVSGGAPVYLTGDNSGFSGKMTVTCVGTPTEADGTTLHLGQGTSFGGAMASVTADGVLLEKYGFLMPEQTMTLNAANRGITVTAGGFDVPVGVALTVAVPLTVDGAALKRGAGELALSGAATFASGSTFAVKEGSVRALTDAAVAGDFSFADGTTIVLDPDASLVNGFFGNFAVTGEGTPKVTVAVDTTSAAFDADGAATLPICTVPATAADLTGSFTLAKVRGCSAELVKENVTVEGVQCVRYSERFSKAGTVIYVR